MAMPQTLAQPAQLTKPEYLQLGSRYTPKRVRTIFILESPPASGKYFYNPAGSVNEPLFRAMMRDVLGKTPATKEEGLEEFPACGYLLIDATYSPVNRIKGKARDTVILRDYPLLLSELHKFAGPKTGIVLVKTNVCRLLEPKLKDSGFNILNAQIAIPFPSSGQQNKFCAAIREVLGR